MKEEFEEKGGRIGRYKNCSGLVAKWRVYNLLQVEKILGSSALFPTDLIGRVRSSGL